MQAQTRSKAAFLRPDEALKRKALSFEEGLGLELDPENLARVEAVIDQSKDGFVVEITERLRAIRRALPEYAAAEAGEQRRLLEEIRENAYGIKGLGATFGYPLLTSVAKLLHDYVDRRESLTRRQQSVIGLHIDALYVILAQRLTNLPETTEASLLTGLAMASARHP